VLALPIRRHSSARVWVGTKGTWGWGRTGSVGGCEGVGVLTWHLNELWWGLGGRNHRGAAGAYLSGCNNGDVAPGGGMSTWKRR